MANCTQIVNISQGIILMIQKMSIYTLGGGGGLVLQCPNLESAWFTFPSITLALFEEKMGK